MPTRSRHRDRPGYTMIELIMVIVVVGVLFAMALPRFSAIKSSTTLRAGRQQFSSVVASARSAALLKGRLSAIVMGGSMVTVWAQTGLFGNWVRLSGPVRFDESGITITPIWPTSGLILFDPRGLPTPVPNEILRYELSIDGAADTVCVSRAGILMQRGCTL